MQKTKKLSDKKLKIQPHISLSLIFVLSFTNRSFFTLLVNPISNSNISKYNITGNILPMFMIKKFEW